MFCPNKVGFLCRAPNFFISSAATKSFLLLSAFLTIFFGSASAHAQAAPTVAEWIICKAKCAKELDECIDKAKRERDLALRGWLACDLAARNKQGACSRAATTKRDTAFEAAAAEKAACISQADSRKSQCISDAQSITDPQAQAAAISACNATYTGEVNTCSQEEAAKKNAAQTTFSTEMATCDSEAASDHQICDIDRDEAVAAARAKFHDCYDAYDACVKACGKPCRLTGSQAPQAGKESDSTQETQKQSRTCSAVEEESYTEQLSELAMLGYR